MRQAGLVSGALWNVSHPAGSLSGRTVGAPGRVRH